MYIVTDPQFYYTFSKYYLCNNSTASLLAVTEFRQLKPLHSFKNILLLSTQSGNKKKQHEKRGREKGSLMPGALEHNPGRAEPWEGQIYIMGQKKTSVEIGGKTAFE